MKRIILASSSPRRKQLLEQIKLDFEVIPSNYTEENKSITDPHELVKKHAYRKAKDVASRFNDAIVIGADSIVVVHNEILEKPKSKEDAKEMLRKLSNTSHQVVSGFCLTDSSTGKSVIKSVASTVWFKKLSDEEIDQYVATGEPMDKAGAYGIQERGALFVRKVEGDYPGIVGLPLSLLAEELEKFGRESPYQPFLSTYKL